MIIIASDKFKGTFSAREISRVIAEEATKEFPGETTQIFPMADGGEGTAEILAAHKSLPRHEINIPNPYGRPMPSAATYYSDGETAVVDSAALLGKETLGDTRLSPTDATTLRLGKLLRKLDADRHRHIYIGVGGTMTSDGGAGMLQALGVKFYCQTRCLLETEPVTPRRLASVTDIRFPNSLFTNNPAITALIDVDVPLLPVDGLSDGLSSLSFAGQKGATNQDIEIISSSLSHYLNLISNATGNLPTPQYCGAGGGLGFALKLIDAKPVSGAEFLLSMLAQSISGFETVTRIYTGEGCFDLQSLQGKVTGKIIEHATRYGIPVTVVCGRCELSADQIPPGTTVRLLSDILRRHS